MTNTWIQLATVNQTSAISGIQITGLNSGYTDYVILCTLKCNLNTHLRVNFNGVFTAQYFYTMIRGDGSNMLTTTAGSQASMYLTNGGGGFSQEKYSTYLINVQNPNSTRHKNVVCYGGNGSTGGNRGSVISTGRWENTTAPSYLDLSCDSGTIVGTLTVFGVN